MFCIILADCPHGSCRHSAWKCTFLKPGLRVEKSENAALAFLCGQWICILSVSMMPTPHPSTSSLWPLNPAMSHNNNDNGGLLLVFMFLATYSSQQQFNLIIGPHKQFWFPCTSNFRLLLIVFGFSFYGLFVYSVHALCSCSVSSSLFWVNFKRHL